MKSPVKKFFIVKLAYDAFAAVAALSLAFITRFALLYFEQSRDAIRPDIEDLYLGFFLRNVGLFSLLTVGSIYFFGCYRSISNLKPLRILGGVSAGPVAWSLFNYYTLSADAVLLPRGVTLLAWLYLLLLSAGPRIAKYFVLNNMVVEIHHHSRKSIKQVLVIGGGGYIGSQLVRDLLSAGYKVRILDSFIFGRQSIADIETNSNLSVEVGDFRNIQTIVSSLKGMDAVIHLGGIVGDPACSLDDDLTIDINLTATKMLAELCKSFKVQRFIFASSCSVYGASSNKLLTEESPLNPVSLYAKTKIASEKVLLESANDEFSPTILRFATLFGLSPRPRFDLFINLATAKAVKEKIIPVFGGNQWRPFVHVRDISKAIKATLEAPLEKVHAQIINVGSERNCVTIETAAQIIATKVGGVSLEIIDRVDDLRDYRVSFEKMKRLLSLELATTIEEGVVEMANALWKGAIIDYADPNYSNLSQTKKLIAAEEDEVAVKDNVVRLSPTPRKILNRVQGG